MDISALLRLVGQRALNSEDFEILRARFGNHSKVARILGISPAHYRLVRATGGTSRITANLICLLSDLIQAENKKLPPKSTSKS